MNDGKTRELAGRIVRIAAIIVPLALALWFKRDAVWAFIQFAGDRDAVVAYLDGLGFIGPLVLMGLVGLQVLIPSLPAEPPMIAGAYAYGFLPGFLMSWLVSVAASVVVFYLARWAGRPLVERMAPAKLVDKWTRIADEKGAIFFALAFIIPPIPSDIMTYVAGVSTIKGRRFFLATLIGRAPMVALLSLVGAHGFGITPALLIGLTLFGVLALGAWWCFMRERPDSRPATGGSDALPATISSIGAR